MAETSILNISGYKFVVLKDLPDLRERLKAKAQELNLKGTILLSEEGINAFLAASEEAIRTFCSWLAQDIRFSEMPWKDSWSEAAPFNRILVKIKKEIISMDAPMLCQEKQRAKSVKPQELKVWLDHHEEVVLLDTRNDYEVKLGTFEKAVHLDIDHFRQFPEKIKALLPQIKNKKVVAFCTGGVRCEKAVLLMDALGCESAYQLDGGILKYFEECHEAHYQGDCFVFDKRVAVDPYLQKTQAVMCFACLSPLTAEEQKSPLYIYEKQCPYCADKRKPIQSTSVCAHPIA